MAMPGDNTEMMVELIAADRDGPRGCGSRSVRVAATVGAGRAIGAILGRIRRLPRSSR